MSETSAAQDGQAGGHGHKGSKAALAVGAIGIVFGDIGTSPLYAFRETFVGPHPLALDTPHVLGVISLIFWSMTLVVSPSMTATHELVVPRSIPMILAIDLSPEMLPETRAKTCKTLAL